MYLNLIILVRRDNDEPTEKLISFRNGLRDLIIKTRKEKMTDIKDDLPTYNELMGKYGYTPEKAQQFIEEALTISENQEDQWQQANLLAGFGNLLIKTGKENEALDVLFKALEINQKLGAVAEQSEIYQLIYQVLQMHHRK